MRAGRRLRPAFAFLALLGTLAVALADCRGFHESAANPHVARDLHRAQRFTGFPLYWAGMRLGKLPLTSVTRAREHFGEDFTFTYGTCDASGDEASCAPPMEIQVTNLCNRLPKDLGLHSPSRARMRGALSGPAEAGADNGPDLSLYVRGATITIYGWDARLVADAVAALRGANRSAHAEVGERLPAATRRQIAGAGC